ncbi:MAG: imidazolonepropionase [Neolewinella sp.]|jgi:imidazolonepropionase
MPTLIGPFTQLLPLARLSVRGALQDEQLDIITNGGILVSDGKVVAVGRFHELYGAYVGSGLNVEELTEPAVGLPGLIDCHTHLCFAGSRARDYAARNGGKTYQEIAGAGGGIKETVRHTRAATYAELSSSLAARLDRHLRNGVTTVEVKSGYGLTVEDELRMLRIIRQTGDAHAADVVATCLAAHVIPPEMDSEEAWLKTILEELAPVVKEEKLARRFDIFVEEGTFTVPNSRPFLEELKNRGFQLTVHGDQFTTGGSQLAVDVGALSVDHLEASGAAEIEALALSDTIAVALPGASLGLGCAFTPARRLLDQGASVAIASDWNPGSAPMGDLLTQAAILGTFEKLSATEVFAGITFRAAAALGLNDRGRLVSGGRADLVAFPTGDYREILYHQGQLKPHQVWKNGSPVI